ncbi:MAG: DUF2125 domain-containing protein [Pelagimonas sp.]|jgi:hypothetical protein|nr:DUF2125 domain-containing protein [Pelagimonas sp.]
MKRWIAVIVMAAMGWSVFWAYEARNTRQQAQAWFDTLNEKGWQASHAGLKVRGFPSRLDLTVSDPSLTAPNGNRWQAPFVQVFGLTYQPGHHILAFPDDQSLTLGDTTHLITSNNLRASLVHDSTGMILRTNVEADVINIATPAGSSAFAGVLAGITLTQDASYQIGLSAQNSAHSDQAQTAGQSDVQAIVRFDRAFDLTTLHNDRPQPQNIDLRLARYQINGLELNMAGQVEIDPRGQPSGNMTIRAVNWSDLLDQAVRAGQLPKGFADQLRAGLSMVAGLQGKPDTLDLPLAFSRGQTWLGPIPVGSTPVLKLP